MGFVIQENNYFCDIHILTPVAFSFSLVQKFEETNLFLLFHYTMYNEIFMLKYQYTLVIPSIIFISPQPEGFGGL